jgi:hypothetical protein
MIGWASWWIIVIGTMHWPEKRIPITVREIAAKTDEKQVRAVIEQYPGCEARKRCLKFMARAC